MNEQVGTPEEILLKIARPELYRLNLFRITELPVDAEARDISRRQGTIKQAVDIGVAIPPGYGRVFPLEKAVDPDQLSEAIQRLGEPERRLVDEIFWFWPRELGKSRSDEALATLGRGEISQVSQRWRQLRDVPADGGNALHNLAVLSHASALDWENTALSRDLLPQEQQERDVSWGEAFRSWRGLLESEAFWSQVTGRIRALDDPRLTTGMVQRIRVNLPLALLSINASLAVNAAERGNAAECQRQLLLLRSSGFDTQVVNEALHGAVEPVRERIKTLCKMIETQTPLDPTKADDAARTFLDQSEPMLTVLDLVLPAGDATRDGMHDEVASQAFAAVLRYGNKTSDWLAYHPIVDRIEPLAVGELVLARIKENDEAVDKYLEATLCWYCSDRSADKGAEHNVQMFGNVRSYYVGYRRRRTEWQKLKISVRRCRECQQLHEKATVFKVLGGVLGAVLTVVLAIVIVSGITAASTPNCSSSSSDNSSYSSSSSDNSSYSSYSSSSSDNSSYSSSSSCYSSYSSSSSKNSSGGWVCFGIFGIALLAWFLIWLGLKLGTALDTAVFLSPKKVLAMKDVRSYSPIADRLSQGWRIGTGPR